MGSRLARSIRRALERTGLREPKPPSGPSAAQVRGAAYPGDFLGTPEISYEPNAGNGKVADPGEIVWAWVPFEEDHRQGKDRPVLVIGRDGPWLLALPLTSKDHDRDAAQEARDGRYWTDIGPGAWDDHGRASEARVDRILRLDQAGVRRAGAVLDHVRFDQVAVAVRAARRPPGRRRRPAP